MTLDSRPADDPPDLPLCRASVLLDELLESPRGGVRLWAPPTHTREARAPLHVHVGVFGAPAELDRLAFAERAMIVAVDEATGEAEVVRVGGHGGRDAPKRLAVTAGFEGTRARLAVGPAAQVVKSAMWGPASVGWARGRYRMTAVVAERASKHEAIEITGSTSADDPAVRTADGASAQVWPTPDHAGGLPRYDSVDGSPSVPAEHGVVLAAQPVVSAGDAACALHGSVRSIVTHRVAYGALVPVTLVITGSATPGPWVVRMRVPSFARDAVEGASGVTAKFAVDLFRLAPLASSPQTYFVHAFTADGKSAPLSITVVGGS